MGTDRPCACAGAVYTCQLRSEIITTSSQHAHSSSTAQIDPGRRRYDWPWYSGSSIQPTIIQQRTSIVACSASSGIVFELR